VRRSSCRWIRRRCTRPWRSLVPSSCGRCGAPAKRRYSTACCSRTMTPQSAVLRRSPSPGVQTRRESPSNPSGHPSLTRPRRGVPQGQGRQIPMAYKDWRAEGLGRGRAHAEADCVREGMKFGGPGRRLDACRNSLVPNKGSRYGVEPFLLGGPNCVTFARLLRDSSRRP